MHSEDWLTDVGLIRYSDGVDTNVIADRTAMDNNGRISGQIPEDSLRVTDVSNLLRETRQTIYDWFDGYDNIDAFKASGVKVGTSIYYPRTQWDALLASAGQTLPTPTDDPEVIEAELMPEEARGVLAKLGESNENLEKFIQKEMSAVLQFVDDLNEVEKSLSEAELQAYRQAGIKRGIDRFRVETRYEVEVVNQLRQKRLNTDQPDS